MALVTAFACLALAASYFLLHPHFRFDFGIPTLQRPSAS